MELIKSLFSSSGGLWPFRQLPISKYFAAPSAR